MGEILVGTCSWTDPALVKSGWYPPGARSPEGRLRHYALRFPVVEVDSTYYALPSARNSSLWAQRTPPDFVFDVKAFSLLTGHPTQTSALPPGLRPDDGAPGRLRSGDVTPRLREEVWTAFLDGLAPLRETGRLGSLLLQFPPWFRPGDRSEAYLAECRERAGDLRLAAEFRDPRWVTPPELDRTLDLLRRLGLAHVAVDTAQELPGSMPPVTAVTSPRTAVVRFHGRSPDWGTGSKEDRFRHRYSRAELAPWIPRIKELARETQQVHVLFNNCCADAAVTAAGMMTEMLQMFP